MDEDMDRVQELQLPRVVSDLKIFTGEQKVEVS